MRERINVSYAVGQAINILAEKGMAPIIENTKKVMDWTKFILNCQDEGWKQFNGSTALNEKMVVETKVEEDTTPLPEIETKPEQTKVMNDIPVDSIDEDLENLEL